MNDVMVMTSAMQVVRHSSSTRVTAGCVVCLSRCAHVCVHKCRQEHWSVWLGAPNPPDMHREREREVTTDPRASN
jgi:hypothetical protein